jgi:hypothetical protein
MAMKTSFLKLLGYGFLVGWLGLTVSACNTTKATLDTTGKFTMSTSPEDLFTADGLVKEDQKATLYTAVVYDNLQEDIARGQGEYLASLGTLMEIPADRQNQWALGAQSRYADLFSDHPQVEEMLVRLRRE